MSFASKSAPPLTGRATLAVSCLLALVSVSGCAKRKEAVPVPQVGTVRGRVTGPEGQPLSAAVSAVREPAAPSGGPGRRVETSRSGEFTLADLSPGAYVVRGEAPEHAAASVTVEVSAGEEVSTSLRL